MAYFKNRLPYISEIPPGEPRNLPYIGEIATKLGAQRESQPPRLRHPGRQALTSISLAELAYFVSIAHNNCRPSSQSIRPILISHSQPGSVSRSNHMGGNTLASKRATGLVMLFCRGSVVELRHVVGHFVILQIESRTELPDEPPP